MEVKHFHICFKHLEPWFSKCDLRNTKELSGIVDCLWIFDDKVAFSLFNFYGFIVPINATEEGVVWVPVSPREVEVACVLALVKEVWPVYLSVLVKEAGPVNLSVLVKEVWLLCLIIQATFSYSILQTSKTCKHF